MFRAHSSGFSSSASRKFRAIVFGTVVAGSASFLSHSAEAQQPPDGLFRLPVASQPYWQRARFTAMSTPASFPAYSSSSLYPSPSLFLFRPNVRSATPRSATPSWPLGPSVSRPPLSTVRPVAPAPRKADTDRLSTEVQVSVFADQDDITPNGLQRSFTIKDVESTAGAFNDLPRFIQTIAGVVADNDQRNDFLVRGGNPNENLFMIDNIEVPSINQLALSDTSGGLVSMLDNSAIQHFYFQDDAYGSRYDQHLSSVTDISTRTFGKVEPHHETEFGIAGTGGSESMPFGRNGSYFLSARSGILQYITNDIGFNGTPHYRNIFARAENSIGAHDSWWGMSLFGIDSIQVRPSAGDPEETNPIDINYSGWRNATGINWQHFFSPNAFSVASLAHTEQTQNIAQFDQIINSGLIYDEHSRDSVSTLKYDVTLTPTRRLLIELGGRGAMDVMGYNVNQPVGLQNSYSSDPRPTDPGTFGSNHPFLTSGAYADVTLALPHDIRISGGERYSDWTLLGRSTWTARAAIAAPIFGHNAFFNYAEHSQLPPQLYLLAFNNLQTLSPIRTRQLSVGVNAIERDRIHVTLAAYNKTYSDYPVATEYPQVSLANISDTFGQAFLLFPMTGTGTGVARGIEMTTNAQLTHNLTVSATASYARSWYAGLDGVMRRGNFDIPAAGNLMARWQAGREFTVSGRFNITSGRPYTPDNLPLSIAQDRDVYDLTRVNGVRSSSYQRLDFRVQQDHKLNGNKVLTWYAGLENALDRKNFYSILWEPRKLRNGQNEIIPPVAGNGSLQSVQNQLGLFPDAGVRFTF